jgi:SAM-dependent methyltransferase
MKNGRHSLINRTYFSPLFSAKLCVSSVYLRVTAFGCGLATLRTTNLMYEQIARYYDLIHAQLTADLPLLQTLAQEADGPILELGCGTGRLLRPLARAGHRVTGVDNSEEMLAYCRQKLANETAETRTRITLVKTDLLALDTALRASNERFALAVVSHNTLMHLTLNQVSEMLQQLRPYLSENGRLFIDVANPFLWAETADSAHLTLENQLTDPQTDAHILQFATGYRDEQAHIQHVTWIFDVSAAGGGPVQRYLSQMVYHYFYPHELELALQAAGYRLLHFWGDYDQISFNEDSERLLILASRQ